MFTAYLHIKEGRGKGMYRDSDALQVKLVVPGFRQVVQPPDTTCTAKTSEISPQQVREMTLKIYISHIR